MPKNPPAPLDAETSKRLHDAFKNNDLQTVKAVLNQGVHIDSTFDDGKTLLAKAMDRFADEIALALWEMGADGTRGNLDYTWTIRIDSEKAMRFLIEQGVDVNKPLGRFGHPLGYAAKWNKPHLMRLLLDAGADPSNGGLADAVKDNSTEAALMLIKAGAEVPKSETHLTRLLSWSIHKRNSELAQALITGGADLGEQGELWETPQDQPNQLIYKDATPLIIAAATGQKEIVQALLDAGASLYLCDIDSLSPIDFARQNNHSDIIALLETAMKAKPQASDPSGNLIFAVQRNELDLVKKLLAAGADVNVRDRRPDLEGYTPLMLAARFGHLEIVKTLLDAGADIAAKDDTDPGPDANFNFMLSESASSGPNSLYGSFQALRTALHWACEHSHPQIVELLLKRGAEVNQPERAKMTPLHIAAQVGNVNLVEQLLAAGADVNAVAYKKNSVLHLAARAGNVEIIQKLLDAKAKPDNKNADGRTPLMIAASRAKSDAVSALIRGGAKVATTDKDGQTPLFDLCGSGTYDKKYVKGQGFVAKFKWPQEEILKTIQILVDAGADPNAKNKHDRTAIEYASRNVSDSDFFKQVIELLQSAKPVAPATEAKPAKPKAPPKPTPAKKEVPFVPPSFKKESETAKFKSVLAELEKLTGGKPHALENVEGAFTFEIHSSKRKDFDLEAVQKKFLDKGSYVYSPDSEFGSRIAVLPTTSCYDVMLAMQTNGQNDDLMPPDIVAWMKKLEVECPFILTGIGFDFLSGRFTKKISKPATLAKKLDKFCSDIAEGDVESLAMALKESDKLFLWWD